MAEARLLLSVKLGRKSCAQVVYPLLFTLSRWRLEWLESGLSFYHITDLPRNASSLGRRNLALYHGLHRRRHTFFAPGMVRELRAITLLAHLDVDYSAIGE